MPHCGKLRYLPFLVIITNLRACRRRIPGIICAGARKVRREILALIAAGCAKPITVTDIGVVESTRADLGFRTVG